MALLVIAFVVMPAFATTISFSNVGMEKDNIQIYNPDGTLFGTYNTSSYNIALNDSTAYSLLVIPANDNLLANHPDTWFSRLIDKFSQNSAVYIVILFCLVVLGIAISRNRR